MNVQGMQYIDKQHIFRIHSFSPTSWSRLECCTLLFQWDET